MVFLEKWSSFSCDRNLQKVALFCDLRSGEIVVFLEKWSSISCDHNLQKWPYSAICDQEKLYSFSCDHNLQKVTHFCNSRSREIVWFLLRNGPVFLEIVICRKWPCSAICDHEKLYSFSWEMVKFFLRS